MSRQHYVGSIIILNTYIDEFFCIANIQIPKQHCFIEGPEMTVSQGYRHRITTAIFTLDMT